VLSASGGAANPGKNGLIVFVLNGRLSVVEPNGTGLKQIVRVSGHRLEAPAWSPDGTKLAFDDGLSVYVANADGTGVTDITTPSIKNNPDYFAGGCDSEPTWSPDGTQIAVSAVTDTCTGSAGEIDAMSPTGTNRHVIEADYEGLLGGDTQPAWGPGGSVIAITRSDSERMASGPYIYNLYLINARTGKVVKQVRRDDKSSGAAFSPDGQELAFVDGRVITIRTQAGKLIPLVPGGRPAWSPDGKLLAYIGKDGLRLMNVSGTSNRLIVRCSSCAAPSWQPLRP
jgi:Tol biopolymer transport system component